MVRPADGGLREIEWPRNEFQAGTGAAVRDLVVGLCIEPHLRWRAYCDAFLELVRALAIERVLLLGAHLADVVYSRPVAVSGFSSAPDELARIGAGASRYQGPTGIVGVLADRLLREGVATTSLWAGLPHYIGVAPNPRGALALVRSVEGCLGLRVDAEPLIREAAAFEARVTELVAADPELSEYVKQLKRREFAQ
jgi:predicted ATP-grasp superfamily ATP-dependent carboligase